MPTVLNEYVGDGVSKSFNIAMEGGYLSRDYVKFYVRPVDALLDWTPLTNNTVTWTGEFSFTLATAIPVDSVLVVFRETPLTPLVDFQNTSRITEKNLDIGVTQPLHKVAELTDLVDRGAALSEIAMSTAGDALVIAEAAEAAANQAVIDAASAIATSNGASAVANSALAQAGQAVNTANAAALDAAAATSNANTALSQANAAVSTANSANNNATAALNTANTAYTMANDAATVAGNALTASNTANNNASQAANAAASAQSSATAAQNAAQSAAASADVASSVATSANAAATTATNTANTALSTANAAALQAANADDKATQALAQSGTALSDSSTALTAAQQAETDANTALIAASDALALIEQAVAGSVASFNGRDGNVIPQVGDYTAAMVGLGNVNNTADLDKPISTAVQAALDEKAGAQDLTDLADDIEQSLDPRISALETGKANTTHTHTIADVVGLEDALDGKAAVNHNHAISGVVGLQSALDGKSSVGHGHSIGEVSGLQSALDGKSPVGHGHSVADVSGLQGALDSKAAAGHTHTIADVSGLQTALNGTVKTTGDQTVAGVKTFTDRLQCTSGTPTVHLHNTAHRSAFLHCGSDRFFILGGDANSNTWTQVNGQWPLTIDLTTNAATFGGGVTAVGEIWSYGNVGAYSDRRLKTNIEPIKYALAKVATLGGYTYTREDLGGELHAGVIAQEVQEVLPMAVSEDDNGTLRVSTNALVGLLVQAVRELNTKVEALEKGK